MSKNHIYLHTSDLRNIEYLRKEKTFENIYDYIHLQRDQTHPNELGRLKTQTHYYHILIGRLFQKGCPWCGNEPVLKQLENHIKTVDPANQLNYNEHYCLECVSCGSRGPILRIDTNVFICDISKKYFTHFITHKYQDRRQWDDGLIKENS